MITNRDADPPLEDIRGIIRDLIPSRPLEVDRCRHWTAHHLVAIRQQGVAPWLYHRLCLQPHATLPQELLQALRYDYMASALAAASREAPLNQMLEAFEDQRLELILLKGAYLGLVIYGDPALRPMSDVDILVREKDYDRAQEVLLAAGYVLAARDSAADIEDLNRAAVYSLRGNVTLLADLHRGLWSMDYYRIPEHIIWNNIVQGRFNSRRVHFLSPEMNFLHLAIHNLNHIGLLRDWLDLALLIKQTDLDWDRLVSLARSSGVMRPLYFVCADLGTGFQVVPKHVMQSLALYAPHWLEDRVIRHRLSYLWRLFARLRRLPGWRTRVGYLRLKLSSLGSQNSGSSRILGWFSGLSARFGFFLHLWRGGR